ncbi:hypothetical protein PoB_006907000 [Plakobranchus ocellatus]|uniref:Uncharacterized protein n=1 Tax=Plakobranchus ocellatus TaxID=259542 RepID=A0AAV4DEM0_9GAST|nr:hypothetical protein PoB_006907000 [Plakobranchus ocellatus]
MIVIFYNTNSVLCFNFQLSICIVIVALPSLLIGNSRNPSQVQDDLATRIRYKRKWHKVPDYTQARYKLNEFGTDRGSQYSVLDKLMYEVPGKDNAGAFIKDDAFGLASYDISKSGNVLLNTAKYHRWYKLAQAGAMGLQVNHRGYHDENLWVALNTQKDIMPLTINRWVNGKQVWETRRVSYAIPIEIVYTTPLANWNPYDIEFHGKNNTPVTLNHRNGGKDKAHAYNGNSIYAYYRVPKELYKQVPHVENNSKGVLDKNGNLRLVLGAGPQTFSYPFEDFGKVRLRYPIFPVHFEGTTVGMELEALKDSVLKMSTYAYLYENQPMASGSGTTPTNVDVNFHVRDSYR